MNDYNDDSDEYSSANSFRARSNTWPLNRPELTVPNASICIDEPLPEIELEEEDLFTTNDNWTTGLEDHDIMSWDPILNAQSQLQQQQHQAAVAAAANANTAANVVGNQQPQQQATIIHHHHQPTNHLHQAHNSQSTHVQQPEQASYHQRQQSVHLQHLPPPPPLPPQPQQQQQQPQPQQATPKHHQQLHSHLHSPHEPILGCNVSTSSVVTGPTAANGPLHQQHQPHQHQHQHHHHHPHHHQTLNNPHCLDPDDTNDYHIQQLHHLRLDSNPQAPGEPQSSHYVSQISSVCIQASSSIGNESYTTSDHQQNHHHHHNNNHHHQHHLQPLTSARYDLVQTNEYNLKTHDVDLQNPSNHLNRHNNHHLQHHHMNHHQSQQHQLQNLTSTVLDGHSGSSHPLLSSSLSISGIGLNGDLEDLDYKSVDPSAILQSLPYDDLQPLQQQQQQSQDPLQSSLQVSPIGDESVGNNETKQSNSNSTSKTKLNTPRRNAWGNMSYADLISQAINSTSDKRLTLSQIYDWMVQHVPYFKDKGDSNSSAGWKNSVRHNLSLHSRFKRLQNEGTGKSSWWTINPEANVGKCARRRAASMEASKYEKKRGRAKKRAEAVRQGLVSYPSLTNSSLNGSTTTLDQQQSQAQSIDQFHNQPTEQIHTAPSQQQQQEAQRQQRNVQPVDQFASQPQQSQKQIQQQAQTQQQQTLDHYGVPDGPSHQQQQHLQHLQQMDGQNNLHDQGLYGVASQEPQYEEKNDKISQQQQHQQSQYYYQFELSTAL